MTLMSTLKQQFQLAAASDLSLPFNPADFVSGQAIDNKFFPLTPGTTMIYGNSDGVSTDEFSVTRQTKVIDGVRCTVIIDTAFEDGVVAEKTTDYFAQDKFGNVWYFGEDTQKFIDGVPGPTTGTWRAGVNGATPGIIMLASPQVGDSYFQENAVGVAQDHATVQNLAASASSPYASSNQALLTLDDTPLDATLVEQKFYVDGIGAVLVHNVITGEDEFLVKQKIDGTRKDDALNGNVGSDELNGLAGNDVMDGKGGTDTLNGGRGNDTLEGGNDTVKDILNGDAGNDTIHVRTADEAFGGDGNDRFLLHDNTGFGLIDGGDERGDNVGRSQGDIVVFDGVLDLTEGDIGDRIVDIETFSMADGQGNDTLRLSLDDVIEIDGGEFEARVRGQDFDEGEALRIEGDAGDKLILSGGDWHQIAASNAPAGYNVFVANSGDDNAYAIVDKDIITTVA